MKSFCGYFLKSFCKFIKPILGRCSCLGVYVCVGVGVFARFKSNLLALLSSLATQQLFSHITYTQRVPNSMFTDLRPHPLYIKKKLFLDILANDFSSSRLLGSTGKPDRAANRWPQFACLAPVSAHVLAMLSLFLGLWNLTGNLKIVLLLQQTVRQINLRPDSRVIWWQICNAWLAIPSPESNFMLFPCSVWPQGNQSPVPLAIVPLATVSPPFYWLCIIFYFH